ncbi:MAG: tRNA (N6-isopentenyl adenosine(37)-C2)-methylthiotransferase MiaB [Clostridia bacterium]|nr:tRNA (N6-isopentenyl adenosine(37)-C2)-methylthiotransferase MiaB [Clostridia bacterium]
MRFVNSYETKIKKLVQEKSLTYSIDTMGCQMNENDSSKYMGILESMGFRKTTSDKANLILFNTCCVRENAENTLFGRLGFLKKRKLNEENVYIVVVGCMTQQRHILEKIKESYKFVDIVLGTGSMSLFPEKLYNVLFSNKKEIEYIEAGNEIEEDIPIIYEDKYKASVSIIYGCNNFCSYCIVPYVRGRERSRRPEDILKDIEKLAKNGYKEIMLLGQNVNSYGNDFKDRYTFPDLLKDIEKIDGIEIIRFMSPHPKDFKDDLIEVIRNSKKIARQIHLPLQSGSTKILKEMNRKYTKEEYLTLAKKLKAADPEISLSTDIIVGFPGESEKDFEDTLDVVSQIKFDQIYMFIYSKREGTKAAKMEDFITNSQKVERLERLKRLYENELPLLNKKMIGRCYKVLVEGKSKNNDEFYTGRTSQNKVVIFKADEKRIGKIVNVKIDSEHLWYLKGTIEE